MELIVKHFSELTTNELYDLLRERVNVFVVEQTCPYPELDDKDLDCYHVILKENNQILAYSRVLKQGVSYPEVSIGRVLSTQRLQGYGDIVFTKAMEVAKEKYNADVIRIEAQVQALPFYEKKGFIVDSKPFLEDGIPHVEMIFHWN